MKQNNELREIGNEETGKKRSMLVWQREEI